MARLNDPRSITILLLALMIILASQYLGIGSNVVKEVPSSAMIDPGIRVRSSSFDGDTTDFLMMTDWRLQKLENLVLERSGIAKMVFDGPVNLKECTDEDNSIDFDGLMNISIAQADMQFSSLGCLDHPVTMYFYGISIDNPIILIDGKPCSPDVCRIISNVNGTLVVVFPQFDGSVYKVVNKSQAPVDETGGGNPARGRRYRSAYVSSGNKEDINASANETEISASATIPEANGTGQTVPVNDTKHEINESKVPFVEISKNETRLEDMKEIASEERPDPVQEKTEGAAGKVFLLLMLILVIACIVTCIYLYKRKSQEKGGGSSGNAKSIREDSDEDADANAPLTYEDKPPGSFGRDD